jgi:hypothetical protein
MPLGVTQDLNGVIYRLRMHGVVTTSIYCRDPSSLNISLALPKFHHGRPIIQQGIGYQVQLQHSVLPPGPARPSWVSPIRDGIAWPELAWDLKLAMRHHAGRIGVWLSSIFAGIHRYHTWNITFAAGEAAESTLHNVNHGILSGRMHTYGCLAADGLPASVGISCTTVQILHTLRLVAVEQRRRRRHPSID